MLNTRERALFDCSAHTTAVHTLHDRAARTSNHFLCFQPQAECKQHHAAGTAPACTTLISITLPENENTHTLVHGTNIEIFHANKDIAEMRATSAKLQCLLKIMQTRREIRTRKSDGRGTKLSPPHTFPQSTSQLCSSRPKYYIIKKGQRKILQPTTQLVSVHIWHQSVLIIADKA